MVGKCFQVVKSFNVCINMVGFYCAGVLLLTETDVIEERFGDKDERNVSLKSSESREDEA